MQSFALLVKNEIGICGGTWQLCNNFGEGVEWMNTSFYFFYFLLANVLLLWHNDSLFHFLGSILCYHDVICGLGNFSCVGFVSLISLPQTNCLLLKVLYIFCYKISHYVCYRCNMDWELSCTFVSFMAIFASLNLSEKHQIRSFSVLSLDTPFNKWSVVF